MKTRRTWNTILQLLQDHKGQPRLLYPEKLSAILKEQRKTFYGIKWLKQPMYTKRALQTILEARLQTKERKKLSQEATEEKPMEL